MLHVNLLLNINIKLLGHVRQKLHNGNLPGTFTNTKLLSPITKKKKPTTHHQRLKKKSELVPLLSLWDRLAESSCESILVVVPLLLPAVLWCWFHPLLPLLALTYFLSNSDISTHPLKKVSVATIHRSHLFLESFISPFGCLKHKPEIPRAETAPKQSTRQHCWMQPEEFECQESRDAPLQWPGSEGWIMQEWQKSYKK